MISEPRVDTLLNGYRYTWSSGSEWVIKASIIKLVDQSRGGLTGELSIEHEFKDRPTISGIRFNLTSQQARNTIAKRLVDAKIITATEWTTEGLDWAWLVEQICSRTINLYRQGEPLRELWTSEDMPPPEYLIEPILLKDIPTVIFGEKGVTKSTLALIFYTMLVLPWHDNPLGLTAPKHSVRSIILDWEVSGNIAQWNAKKFQEGMGLPPFPLYHRRCNAPLSDDIEAIQEMIVKTKAEVVIIDSLARAAGGDLNKDTENANRFFSSLDKLKVTPLIIAQTSKDTISKTKTIFGSTMYTYYARSIFELCKSQDAGEDDMSVALFHRWSNLTKLQKPIGLRFTYNGNKTFVDREALDIQEFKAKMSGKQLLFESLKSGSKSAKELADEIGWQVVSVSVLLSRLKKLGKVVSLGDGKWGLAY